MPIVTFYRGHPNPPKTTMPARLGANAIIICQGKLLLEKRSDCDIWGLVGGGVKKHEEPIQAITREIKEELGLQISPDRFRKLAVYGEPGRIAAYQDGSVWRMVVVVFELMLSEIPDLVISRESKELRFFSKEEVRELPIVVTYVARVSDSKSAPSTASRSSSSPAVSSGPMGVLDTPTTSPASMA